MKQLQDIFREYVRDYAAKYHPSPRQWKVINAVMRCRTGQLGAHTDVCEECGAVEISYNSCNNRHCNQCQTIKKETWLAARKEELLETGYFHTVFTIPAELNGITAQNKKIMYNILFKASSETVLTLCADKKYLNGQAGMTAVLHTWGQNLHFHPHIHQIVPGGVLTHDDKWRRSGEKYLLPVKVLGKVFRGKFLYYLKKSYSELRFFGEEKEYENETCFQNLTDRLYRTNWVVYSKAPFKSAGHVLEYLGRYTHRVAISNNRILSSENEKVSFKWRDYKDGNKQKVMELPGVEFMRRVLTHILPDRFVKIRHYGFLSNACKKKRLRLAQKLTGSRLMPLVREKLTVREFMMSKFNIDITKCRHCGGNLIGKATCPSRASPPEAGN